MNEVNKIHLGRQAFTIALDAHHELKSYLAEISKQVGDKDVTEEVELRMAELLSEHGITGNKVILPKDVDFLKAQLGDPKDFTEDEDQSKEELKNSGSKRGSKKLFRDTDNAMIAGVAAGLSQYFGIDVLLIRLLFVVVLFLTFGGGIVLYIILWLLVPEARSSSDRLQMAGRPVTLDSLKDIVERVDVKGAAHRANATISGPINTLFSIFLKLIGIVFVLSGLIVVFGLIASQTYLIINNSAWTQNNIFPVGLREHFLLDTVMVIAGLMGIFVILFGIAIFRRKWPIKVWVTGILVGLIFIGLAVGGALAGDVYPTVRDRYYANIHTHSRNLAPFSNVEVVGPLNNINFIQSNSYSVNFSYYDHPNINTIRTVIQNNTLIINTSGFSWNRHCSSLCIPDSYNLAVNVYSPDSILLSNNFNSDVPVKPIPPLMPQ